MAEQSWQTAGVQEDGLLFASDPPVGDARDESGERACRVGGIEEDPFSARGQPHRLTGGRGQYGVAGADLASVDLQVRTSRLHA